MSAFSLVSRQALRLGIILLVCAGIAVATSTLAQSPIGTAALTSLAGRGGPDRGPGPGGVQGFQRLPGFQGQVPSGAAQAGGGGPQARGAAPQEPDAGFRDAGPREGGGRLLPNLRAGLPELLRSAATLGVFALGVALVLRWRKPTRRPAQA